MVPPPPKDAGSLPTEPGQPQGNLINLMTLSPQELQELRQQAEGSFKFSQNVYASLKQDLTKMQISGYFVKSLSSDKTELLVPATSSMYVKGELENPGHVLIDIGSGYFVEKDLEQAKDYFKRKDEFLTAKIEKVQQLLREKATIRSKINHVLKVKLQTEALAATCSLMKTINT